jgi:hypothetical protein
LPRAIQGQPLDLIFPNFIFTKTSGAMLVLYILPNGQPRELLSP